MTSSLASQLTKIQSLSSSRLTSSKGLTTQQSYLFPTRTASSKDIDTIHHLAQNGWNELSIFHPDLNDGVLDLGSELFGESSKGIDRTMLNKVENEELDRKIQNWLRFFNGDLLSKPMAKCLEWLVRRYRVHEFNVEMILAAFIPYHDTPQFARMLQILKLDDKPQFAFLLPLQKTGSSLTMPILLSQLLSSNSNSTSLDLLNWISKLPISFNSNSIPFTSLLNFWTSILTQFLISTSSSTGQSDLMNSGTSTNQSRKNQNLTLKSQQSEMILNIILPNVVSLNQNSKKFLMNKGKDKGKEEIRLASESFISSNLILSTISICFPLSLNAVKGIVESCFILSSSSGDNNSNKSKINLNQNSQASIFNALISLSCSIDPNSITASPLTIQGLTEVSNQILDSKSIESLVDLLGGSKNLIQFIKSYFTKFNLNPFLEFFLGGLLSNLSSEKCRKVLNDFLNLEEEGEIAEFQSKAIGVLLELNGVEKEVDGFRIQVLPRVRQRKPEIFETALKNSLSNDSDSQKKDRIMSLVKQILSFSGSSTSTSASTSTATGSSKDFYLGIYDSSPIVRNSSLENLFQSLQNKEIAIEDSFVQDSIKARLLDNDPNVLTTLYENSKVLLDILFFKSSSNKNAKGKSSNKSLEVLNLFLIALDSKMELGRNALRLHLKFICGEFLSRVKSFNQDNSTLLMIQSIIVKNVLFNRLLMNKANKKTSEMVYEVLKETFSSIGDEDLGDFGLLKGVWEDSSFKEVEIKDLNEKEKEEFLASNRNQLISQNFSNELKKIQVSDRPRFTVWLDFLIYQFNASTSSSQKDVKRVGNNSPQWPEPSSNSRLLSLLILKDLVHQSGIAQDEDQSQIAFKDSLKIVQALDLTQLNFENDKEFENEIVNFCSNENDDDLTSRTKSLIYTKSSSNKTYRLLISILLISILKSLQVQKTQLNQLSFLSSSTKHEDTFQLLSKFYQLSNKANLNPSLGKVLLSNLFELLGSKALNFLIRIWTYSSGNDSLLKLASISHSLAFLKAFLSSNSSQGDLKIDFQTIVPSLLIALDEKEDSIRWKALDCLQVIRDILEGLEGVDGIKVWEYDEIYGAEESADLQYLDAETVGKYLDMILGSRENFKYDSEHLSIMNQSALNVSKEDGRKVANLKHSIICYLLSHTSCFPSISAKISLLGAVSKVADASKLSILLPRIKMILEKSNATSPESLEIKKLDQVKKEKYISLLLQSFDSSSRATLEDKTTGAWSLFLDCLSESDVVIQKHAALALQDGLFSSLDFDMKRDVFLHLVTIVTDGSRTNASELRQCIKSLNAESNILVRVLAQLRSIFPDERSGSLPMASQKKRPDLENAQSQASSAISSVLEGILERSASTITSSLEPNGILIGELFEVLLIGIKEESNLSVNSESIISLTLKSLNSLLEKPIAEKKSSEIISALRIDLIKDAIQLFQLSSSKNPSNFQESLLLLSKIAILNPEPVLQHVMLILTFIAKEGLTRDDSFNFNIMEKTLRSILPPLINSLRNKTQDGGNDHFSLLLRSRDFILNFTNSVKMIPKYRRITFFPILVDILGEKEFLSAVVMLLVDSNSLKISSQALNRMKGDSIKSNLKKEDSIEKSLNLPLTIFRNFGIDAQLIALVQIWLEIKRIWSSKSLDFSEIQDKVFLSRFAGIEEHSSSNVSDPKKQVFSLLTFIERVIKDDNFQTRLRSETRKRNSKEIIGRGIESLIQFSLEMSSVDDFEISKASRSTLESITALSPVSTLMRVVVNLVKSKDTKSQQNGFELLSSRIIKLESEEREVVSQESNVIVESALKVLKDDKLDGRFKISSIKALESLAVGLLESEHSVFSTALPFIISLVSNPKVDVELRKDSFNLIKTLSTQLGPRLIPQIETLSTLSISTVQTSLKAQVGIDGDDQEVLRNSALGTLSGLFISVPLFMTSQLQPILSMSCNPELIVQFKAQNSKSKDINRQNSLSSLLTTLIKNSESQEIFNSIFDTWEKMEKNQKSGLISLLDFLQRSLKFTSRENINKVYKSVFRFILKVWDLRRLTLSEKKAGLTSTDLNEIENSTLKAFLKMVLKLNETTFRPLFLRIFDWSVLDLVEEKELEDSDLILNDLEISSRKLILYKVINSLMNGLNGLVSNYYSTLLDTTIELLNGFQENKISLTNQQFELWNEMISSLKKSSEIDKEGGGFWNPTRLNKILPGLINQLNLLSSKELFPTSSISETQFISKVSSTIVSLAQTVSDESSLKSINSNLLTKTRNSNSRIRIGAISSLTNLWNSLEDALLHLVPETTPFLAELLDDVDEEVVVATRELVGEIEKVLGEPLDEYLQ